MADVRTAQVRSTGEQNTPDDLKPFICGCDKSCRFVPLYQFNATGAKAQLLLGAGPQALWCPECHTMYRWSPPSSPTSHDGGWEKTGVLDDLEETLRRLGE